MELPPLRGAHPPERADLSRLPQAPAVRCRRGRAAGARHGVPLTVDGTIRHPGSEAAWEYSVLIEVHDEHDEMVARRVVGVGALRPGEARKFTLRVEMLVPESSRLTAAS